MSTTTHLGLVLIEQSQAQKEITVNQALIALDALMNTGAIDKDLTAPPGSLATGDVHIVGTPATGDWAGHDGEIAYFNQTWRFVTPNEGMTLWVNDENALYTFNGADWVESGGGGGGGITDLTGDVTASGTGSVTATIAANAVDYSKMQQASAQTLLGNSTGGTADVQEITLGDGLVFDGTALTASVVMGPDVDYFGGGQDGDVTISSGTTNLSRDMYYNNLTLSGTGALNLNGCRVFVKGTLDISAAPTGAIVNINPSGYGLGGNGNALGSGGGAGLGGNEYTLGGSGNGALGGAGNTGAGSSGSSTSAPAPGNGGNGARGGAGGAGSNGSGANSGTTASITQTFLCYKFQDYLMRISGGASPVLVKGGVGGSGGGGGGGDGTNKGGGGGGGGAGGNVVYVCARTIARGTNTTAAIISAKGGNGGNGGSPSSGNAGGGGGGGGAGGGWLYLCYGSLTGTTITDALDASGGTAGNGGTPSGTGSAGDGGTGGPGGRITVLNLTTKTCTESTGSAGSANSGATGGAGNTLRVSL